MRIVLSALLTLLAVVPDVLGSQVQTPVGVVVGSGEDVALSAYPNPFNPATIVRFTIREPADITIAVFDALGREVAVLLHGPQEEGVHSVLWNGRNQSGTQVASGVYFVRMTISTLTGAAGTVATQKILLMK